MAYLDRDGVRIYYEIHGKGRPVLLTHGFAGTSNTWRPNLEALSAHHRVIVWDLLGHGNSDSPADPDDYSLDLTIGDMAALLDVADADRAVIAGHSFGGYASLMFNIAAPQRVAALVLYGCGPGYRSDDARRGWNDMVEMLAAGLDERGLEALWDGAEVDKTSNRSAEGLSRAARGMLAQHDARAIGSLRSIDIPTLVVVGERDEQFRGSADYMTQKVRTARKVVIEGAGHAANIEQSRAFERAVLGFLADIGWARPPTT